MLVTQDSGAGAPRLIRCFKQGRGNIVIDMVMVYIIHVCACLLRCFIAKFGIAISGFSSETKEPKLGVLLKKAPNLDKIGWFSREYDILMSGWVIGQKKNWYRENQIFDYSSIFWRVIIPNGFNSERFYSEGLLLFLSFFTSKGHYSKDFYPQGSLFQRFLSRRVMIILNFGTTTLRDKNLQNNDPSG